MWRTSSSYPSGYHDHTKLKYLIHRILLSYLLFLGYKMIYSITCIQRPPKESYKSGFLQQVVFKCRFYSADLTLSQTTNFTDSSKLKTFRDNNFKFDENGRKHCGKRRNSSLRAISPFPTVFSKDLYCRHRKTRVCLGKG